MRNYCHVLFYQYLVVFQLMEHANQCEPKIVEIGERKVR